ncbi:MAG: hypothetical protein LUG46_08215, partial [Erysipelotrichaceae bacterium]|nr:hypothetical protein [Erysipelotrichaceae bacterium]
MKSVAFLNDYLDSIGFNCHFNDDLFASEDNDKDNGSNIRSLIACKAVKKVVYNGIEFYAYITPAVRPKTDDIYYMTISCEDINDENKGIIAEYLSKLAIAYAKMISNQLYQSLSDGTRLKELCEDVFEDMKTKLKDKDNKGLIISSKHIDIGPDIY